MKKILSIILFTGATFSMLSCKKSFEKINISPNSAADATTNLLLNGAQVSSIVFYEGDIVRNAGMWAGSFTGNDRQYLGVWQYVTAAGDFDNTWSVAYRGVIGETEVIRNQAALINNKIVAGIAQVMKAQAGGTAADLWGDVPFSEAGDAAAFPQPKFDPQATVYTAVQKLLDDAIVNLKSGVGINPGSKDIFYGGNLTKWVKAAYTLKARFYLHTKEYQKAYDNALLGIDDPSSDMIAKHGNAYLTDFNLFYSFLVYDRDTYMSADKALAPRMLDPTDAKYRGDAKTDESARFWYYYLPGYNYFNTYECNINGGDWGFFADNGQPGPDGNGAFGSDESYPILTYKEARLIEAEAAIRLGNFTPALTALNTHRSMITSYLPASYVTFYGAKYDPYTAADFAAGGLKNPGTLAANDALLKQIIEERFISFIGHFEQFNDIRRTKNAIGLAPNVTGAQIPQRMLYPQSEANTNPNTPKQVQADLFKPTPVNL
ncbi:MAG: SusD/RagB family nutrient-binding outer membrane lipoprotein [Ferruginibacter sp.]